MMLGVILFTTTILTSCGPSFCDCVDNVKLGMDADKSKAIKCAEKYDKMTNDEAAKALEQCK